MALSKTKIPNKERYSGCSEVCKTFIRRFDSDPRLQYFNKFVARSPDCAFASVSTQPFLCGTLKPVIRKKCRFCGCRDAKALCDWPTVKRVELRISELKVGDIWITQQAKKPGKIVEIEEQFSLTRRLWVLIPGHPDPYPYDRLKDDVHTVERIQTCDKACCFRHRRRAGPNRHYCMDHWNAWETMR